MMCGFVKIRICTNVNLRHDLICQIWDLYKCVGTWDLIGFGKLEIYISLLGPILFVQVELTM
jgi:hypothetical protein